MACDAELSIPDSMIQYTCDLPKNHQLPHKAIDVFKEFHSVDEVDNSAIPIPDTPFVIVWPMTIEVTDGKS